MITYGTSRLFSVVGVLVSDTDVVPAGRSVVDVLLATVTHVYGLAFPRQTSSDAAEADAAAAALRGGIMAASFNGEGGRMQAEPSCHCAAQTIMHNTR